MMKHSSRQWLRLAMLRAFARLSRAHGVGAGSPDPGYRRVDGASRIVVIRPDHLGDLLFTTPALFSLRQRYPDADITALVGPWGLPVLKNNPHVDHVVALPFPGFSRQPKASFWQPYGLLLRWARDLRRRHELALVLRFDHWWGALLAYLAGIPQRIGYATPEVAPFLTAPLPYKSGRHEVEQNLGVVDGTAKASVGHNGMPGKDSSAERSRRSLAQRDEVHFQRGMVEQPLEFNIGDDARTWVRKILRGRRPIAIHPGAGAAIKLWRSDRWAMVADVLARETGAPILLTGSEAERPLCLALASGMETEAWVMAGETTLDQLAALFGECRLVLGLDSGPLHLAVAMGAPTVHLYGPVDVAKFGPWGSPARHSVVRSAWPCMPCNRLDYPSSELDFHPCVREVSVDAVVTAALGVICE